MLRTLACKRTSCNVFGIPTMGRQSIQRSFQIQERRASSGIKYNSDAFVMRFPDDIDGIKKTEQVDLFARESGNLSLPKREGSLLSAADVAVIKDTIREVLESQEAIRNENISYAVVVCAAILFFVYLNKPSTPAKAQEKDNAI